jgi:hypothetical protein
MVAGMGALLGLCPPPEEWTITDWCQPFGVLPSQLKPEDWRMLKIHATKEWLRSWYQIWHNVASGQGNMPMEVVQYLLALSDEAEKKWQTND